MNLTTWILVVWLNGQPFVHPHELLSYEECSAFAQRVLVLIPPAAGSAIGAGNTSCERSDHSVFKPAAVR